MRKLVVFMHTTLDGFVAGPNGEMNWIQVDEAIFDYAGNATDKADAALYGRTTYEMMDGYWPTAGEEPGASKHDIQHSEWYNRVTKYVLSTTMQNASSPNTVIISNNLRDEILKIKAQPGNDILIFGSPAAVHSLMAEDLIDELWLFVNPVLLGQGIPMFKDITERKSLKLAGSNAFASGVVCLHYNVVTGLQAN